NAAAALVVAGAARDLANAALLATAAIDSGTARATLDAFVAETTLNS
ncbi:MAG: anthranilate phosphoribosyltransferase, partial [Ilumatobacteraceae bacterium]